MKREKVIDTVKALAQEFELEELIEKLVFVEKIEKGIQQAQEGKVAPHEEVKRMIKKWQK